jgi:hypothetical protein
MRKKETTKRPTLTVVNGWERKNFIIKQGDKIEDDDEFLQVEFLLKYKNPKTEYVEFEILQVNEKGQEIPIDFSSQSSKKFTANFVELCELKLLALKTCLTFLKTGALVLEPIKE